MSFLEVVVLAQFGIRFVCYSIVSKKDIIQVCFQNSTVTFLSEFFFDLFQTIFFFPILSHSFPQWFGFGVTPLLWGDIIGYIGVILCIIVLRLAVRASEEKKAKSGPAPFGEACSLFPTETMGLFRLTGYFCCLLCVFWFGLIWFVVFVWLSELFGAHFDV